MNEKLWGQVDRYIEERLLPKDIALEKALAANKAGNLPTYDVSPAQGRFLEIMVKASGARRILEIGTLGGYSAIFMARALPVEGRLISLEYSPRHAEVARANIARAGLSERVEIRVGAAAETLPVLKAEGQAPFDLIFIDADKPNNPVYLDWALKLARAGTTIICDNVIRDGEVVEKGSRDPNVRGARAAFDFLHQRPGLTATALQTVGIKGYDGFAIAIVGAEALI
jgi:predicted O-methyltransferase YrrM